MPTLMISLECRVRYKLVGRDMQEKEVNEMFHVPCSLIELANKIKKQFPPDTLVEDITITKVVIE